MTLEEYPLSDRIADGVQMLLFGMAVIFSILCLIWAILEIFKIVFYDIPNRKKASVSKKAEPADKSEPIAEAQVSETANDADDEELAAVISAAVMMMTEAEGSQTKFRVVSFRRTASK